jgi:hypothetical protein
VLGGCSDGDAPQRAAPSTRTAAPAPTRPPARPALCDGALRVRVTGHVESAAATELSGLVLSRSRRGVLWAHNDSGDSPRLLAFKTSGAPVAEVMLEGAENFDWEDIAIGRDGALLVGDIGDNLGQRDSVVVYRVAEPRTSGTVPVAARYELRYPDGAHDAEALIMAPDGTPYLVTKEVLGASQVFRPAAELVDGGTVALEQAATVNVTLTGTPGGPVGRAGQLLVTGGAVSSDGRLIALRTYTDAYLWPLTGSDVAQALAADPIRIPLPDSPQGEAISFGTDNRGVVIASEGSPNAVVIVPTEQPLAPVAERLAAPADAAPGVLDSDRSPWTSALIAASVAAVAVWLGGKFRRRRD